MLVTVTLFRLRSGTKSESQATAAGPASHPAVGYQEMFSPDQLATEQSYRTVYVPALRRLPGLDRYLIGRIFTPEGHPTRYSHMAAMFWRDRAAWEQATAPGASERLGISPAGEWVETLENYTGDLTPIPPVESEHASGVIGVWLLNLIEGATPGETERYHQEVFAPYDRQRQAGLQLYLTGPTVSLRSAPPSFARMTLTEYRDWAALQNAAPPATPPTWIRPMSEWTSQVESVFCEFEEVPRA